MENFVEYLYSAPFNEETLHSVASTFTKCIYEKKNFDVQEILKMYGIFTRVDDVFEAIQPIAGQYLNGAIYNKSDLYDKIYKTLWRIYI